MRCNGFIVQIKLHLVIGVSMGLTLTEGGGMMAVFGREKGFVWRIFILMFIAARGAGCA